jgi:hypothetical protein
VKSYTLNQSRRPITAYCGTFAIVAGFVVFALPVLIGVLSLVDGSAYAAFFTIPTGSQPMMSDSFGGVR